MDPAGRTGGAWLALLVRARSFLCPALDQAMWTLEFELGIAAIQKHGELANTMSRQIKILSRSKFHSGVSRPGAVQWGQRLR